MLEPQQPIYDPRCDAFAAHGVRDPHAYDDADAAVARITQIYDRGVAIIAEAFARFKAGAKPERPGLVEAFYPFIGITVERSELNLDARRSFGALHDPGIYGTTRDPAGAVRRVLPAPDRPAARASPGAGDRRHQQSPHAAAVRDRG